MFLPYFYLDDLNDEYAVYDVYVLIKCADDLEYQLVLQAINHLPRRQLDWSDDWGTIDGRGCLWVRRDQHDRVYALIRNRLSSDISFIHLMRRRMIDDVTALERAASATNAEQLWSALVAATGWMSTNWLHAQASVRMALRRTGLDAAEADSQFAALLVGQHHSLLGEAFRVAGNLDTSKVEAFAHDWGPALDYASEERVQELLRAAHKWPTVSEEVQRRGQAQRHRSRELERRLLERARKTDGRQAAELLHAQLSLIRTTIWQEERRRQLQGPALHAFRRLRGQPGPRG